MSERPPVSVPLLDLKAQYQSLRDEISAAVDQILESQSFILGAPVARFEEQAAAYLGCRAAVGVASGSDALLLALMALKIGPGCGVIVPPFTFFATVSCIVRLGGTPVFVDIEPETFLITPEAIESVLGTCRVEPQDGSLSHPASGCRMRALLPVHLFGQACDLSRMRRVAARHGLALVEDVAQAMGARVTAPEGTSVAAGTAGDLGCFSFFPTKNLGGVGDGGMVVTNSAELADRLRALRTHGETSRYRHELLGINSRLDALQASVLAVKLRYLEQWCALRIARAHCYHALFSASGLLGNGSVRLPPDTADGSHVFNYYVIRAARRDALRDFLEAHGIQTAVYYPLPLHLQPCFENLGYRRGQMPHAERAATEVLALPMYPELTVEQQEYVVGTIKSFFRS